MRVDIHVVSSNKTDERSTSIFQAIHFLISLYGLIIRFDRKVLGISLPNMKTLSAIKNIEGLVSQ